MDAGRDSTDLLRRLLDRYESRMSYVIVLNQIRGDGFDILNASGQLERAKSLGASVVSIKRLGDAAMTRIDANSGSFWSATQPEDKGGLRLGILERQRVKSWLKSSYEAIAQVDP
jgi:hypothetical protein